MAGVVVAGLVAGLMLELVARWVLASRWCCPRLLRTPP